MSRKRRNKLAEVEDQTYTEVMDENMPEEKEEKKEMSKKTKIGLGIGAACAAVIGAVAAGFMLGKKKSYADSDEFTDDLDDFEDVDHIEVNPIPAGNTDETAD